MAAVFACGNARADDVFLVPGAKVEHAVGTRVIGQIQSESPSEVVVQIGGGSTTTSVPTDKIASVRYTGESSSFALGDTRENAGQLAEAAELFKKAASESEGKPYLVQAALFREARVLTDLALTEPERVKDAKAKLTSFVQRYSNGRHIVLARACQARLQLASEDFAGAEATISALAKLPRASEQAAILRTKVLAKQGKHAAAVAELDRLIATYPKGSERLRAAQLAKAESLAGMKKFKEAEGLLRDVILATAPEDAAAQAPAYNTLGDCLRAANRPKDALLAYLHTDLLYSKDKEEHPRALHYIIALFRQLKQDGRADEFSQRLKQEYPRSRWTVTKSAQ
jgi:outer membrane protein assembly factor BamD (BamD/ComL family)